jgi:hypothetical protein
MNAAELLTLIARLEDTKPKEGARPRAIARDAQGRFCLAEERGGQWHIMGLPLTRIEAGDLATSILGGDSFAATRPGALLALAVAVVVDGFVFASRGPDPDGAPASGGNDPTPPPQPLSAVAERV